MRKTTFDGWRAIGGVIACVALGGCGATTTLEFRSPAGSHLELERSWTNPPRRVEFVSRAEFRQVDSPADVAGAEFRGEIRVDGEIALDRLPPGAERYLIRDGERVSIEVRGYYWIYRFEQTTTDELTAHYVDVTPAQIYGLLEGRAVTVEELSAYGEPVFRFQFGIELPDAETESDAEEGRDDGGALTKDPEPPRPERSTTALP